MARPLLRGVGASGVAVIAVAGHVNVETTVRVDGFPIAYTPARFPLFGIGSGVAGVGFNVAAALAALGNEVRLATIVGQDVEGALVKAALDDRGIERGWVVGEAPATARSVVLIDGEGRRQVNSDLKDLQGRAYPADRFRAALAGCAVAVVGNVNYARPLLVVARESGVPVATDVHALSDLEDAYNRDFMAAADVLFMSGERITEAPGVWAARLMDRYGPEVLVVGLGKEGAVLGTRQDGAIAQLPAVRTREVASTIGAGDALFAAFLHGYASGEEPATALRKAMVFASYKIGAVGGAEGFLDATGLEVAASLHGASDQA